jgi:hypothetical protein
MTITVNLRKMLHRKAAEYCAPVPAGNTTTGSFIVSDKSDAIVGKDIAHLVLGASSIWNYSPEEDSWIQLPNSGITGTFGAGSCGEFRSISAPGGNITSTATAGTTTTLVTALNITRDLVDCAIWVIGGTGSGYIGTIKGNTIGANSVITVNTPSGVAFSATSQFRIFAGSLWFMNAGAGTVGFSVYDRATNTWTARSVAGLPTTWGTDGQLVNTPARTSNKGGGFVNGTAVSAAASTITLEAGKVFLVNQWTNFQIRIISGTGAGQIRTIASNTAGASPVLTVSSAWATQPDATSVYRIEGNDDFLYLLGNNAVTMYRYSISANTWTTLAPTAARAGAHGVGGTADWIDAVQQSDWQDGTYGNHLQNGTLVNQNGRYLYCFRGGATNILDVYDIAANTWISNITYGNQMETFTTGSCTVDLDGVIYIQKDATGRLFKFNIAKNVLDPFVLNPVPQGAAIVGDKMFLTTFKEGLTEINFLYTLGNTRAELTRWLVI